MTVLHFVIVFKKIVLVFLFAKLIALCNQRIHFQSNQVYVRTHCPCNLLNVIAVFNVFQNGVVRERSLRSEDTQSPMIIAKTAFQLFEKRYGWNNPIRSVTVQAINLVPQDTPRQIDMFMDAAKQDKLERMEKCVEEIRRRFGKDSIRNGVLCQNLRLPPEKAEITMPTGMVG